MINLNMLIRTHINISLQLWDITKWCHCATDCTLTEDVVKAFFSSYFCHSLVVLFVFRGLSHSHQCGSAVAGPGCGCRLSWDGNLLSPACFHLHQESQRRASQRKAWSKQRITEFYKINKNNYFKYYTV